MIISAGRTRSRRYDGVMPAVLASPSYSPFTLYFGCGMLVLIPVLLLLGIVLHLREAFSSRGSTAPTYLLAVLLSLAAAGLAVHVYREAGPRQFRPGPRLYFTLCVANVVLLPLSATMRYLRYRR